MSVLTKNQARKYGPRIYTEGGEKYRITATVRYDDRCGNGHNTFSITANIDRKDRGHWKDDTGGCLHREIARHFPELAHLVKWHLCSSDGPMYYIANTLYLAGDKDCHGLRRGEPRQIRNGKTKELCWQRVGLTADGKEIPLHDIKKYADGEKPGDDLTLVWRPWNRIGEGKERELNAARQSAIWPEASDEELTAPDLEEKLRARLPALLKAFQADIEALGFVY